MDPIRKIDDRLRMLRICIGPAAEHRLSLAAKLHSAEIEFTDDVAMLLLKEATTRGARDPSAVIHKWLTSGEWVQMVKDLRYSGEAQEMLEPGKGRQEKSNVGGLLHLATRDNPYGWSKPDQLRAQDHNVAGKWNEFRQSHNLRNPRKNGDCRRYRCSCWEIVGSSSTKAEREKNIRRFESKAEWDQAEVDHAGMRVLAPAAKDATGEVYGER